MKYKILCLKKGFKKHDRLKLYDNRWYIVLTCSTHTFVVIIWLFKFCKRKQKNRNDINSLSSDLWKVLLRSKLRLFLVTIRWIYWFFETLK